MANGQQGDTVLGGEGRLARKLRTMSKLAPLDPPAQIGVHALVWARLGARLRHQQHLVVARLPGESQWDASRTGERYHGSVALSRLRWPAVVYRSMRLLDSV